MFVAKLINAATVKDAEKEIKSIDVSDDCVAIMMNKALFRLVKLHGVRNAVANILKQEMLAWAGTLPFPNTRSTAPSPKQTCF